MTSNVGRGAKAESKSEPTAMTRPPKPFTYAFCAALSAAFGLMSMATTLVAPARAAASARMPDPVPTSATFLPLRSRLARKFEKNLLVRKYLG
jgi:hypothetical protein